MNKEKQFLYRALHYTRVAMIYKKNTRPKAMW